MDIQLKNVNIAKFLSHETLAFTASIYVGGRCAFRTENDGNGGANNDYVVDAALYDALEKYAVSLPPLREFGTEIPYSLELLVADLLAEHEASKHAKRLVKKGYTPFRVGDEVRHIMRPCNGEVVKFIMFKYPTAKIWMDGKWQ